MCMCEYSLCVFFSVIDSPNSSKSLPVGVDVQEYKQLGKNILSVEEISEKFEDAAVHYGKVSLSIR